MAQTKDINHIIHSDSSGKLYIKSPDFFNQPEVKKMVSSIMKSDVFKKITKSKSIK